MNKRIKRYERIKKVMLIFFLIFYFISTNVYATDSAIIESQKESLNISSFIDEANKFTEQLFPDMDSGDLLNSALKGDIDNKTIFWKIMSLFGDELVMAVKILASILVIIVISSILKTISENLENKNIAQITYYVQYILIVTLMFSNFTEVISIAKNTILDLVGFMQNLIPILIALMISTGSIVSANLIQPIILFVVTFIGNIIVTIIIPLVLVGTVLGVLSNISDKIQISKLSKFFKSSVIWILGIILTIFVGLLSLEGTLSSSIDGLTAKTAKAAISNLIPVVGKALGDSIDTVLGSAVILKNAVGFVGIIVIVGICIIPIIKLAVLSITYSIAAALSQPIADGKIVKLLEQFSDTFKILLGIIFVISAMFLIGVAIVVKMSNTGLMYR